MISRAAAGGVLGLALIPAVASAGPTLEVTAPTPSAAQRVGGFHVEPGAIVGARGSAVVFRAGDRAGHAYCNGHGAGSRIVAARLLAKRWHSQPLTGRLRVLSEAGEGWSRTHSQLGHLVTHDGWVDAVSRGCVTVEWLQTGRSAGGAGWNPVFTAQLTRLRVEDLQGPAVTRPAVTPVWVTGDRAHVGWSSSDNGLFRGATGVTGPMGEVSLGDAPNGAAGVEIDVARVADGETPITIWRRAAGWPAATAVGTLRVDRTPPARPVVRAPRGWVPRAVVTSPPGADATSGWRENQIRVDGGGWIALRADGLPVDEGRHRVSVRAVDHAGNVSAAVAHEVLVDATSPQARIDARVTGPGTVRIVLAGTGDAVSGVDSWVVRRGGGGGPVVATSAAPRALESLRLPDGEHRLQLEVRDRAGNVARATSPPLRVDSTAPTVALTRVPGGWIDGFRAGATRDTRLGVTVGDERPGGLGPVQVQLRQESGWRVIARYNEPGRARLPAGSHLLEIDLDAPGISSGPAELRVVAMDPSHPALRSVSASRRVLLDLDAVDYAALGVPEAGVSGARLDPVRGARYWDVTSPDGVRFRLWDLEGIAPPRLRVSGRHRTRRYRGARIPLRVTTFGRRISVAGRIVAPGGRGLPGVVVLMRDPQRRTVARTTTGPRGGFAVRGRATRGGVWSVEAVGRGRLVSRLALRVRPRLGLRVSSLRVRPGHAILLSGAVRPRAGSYAKVVQLQFRDGSRWRPFANTRVDRAGRFRHRYVFRRAGGYRVRMRAVMLRQASWPFTPAVTGPVTLEVGR